MEAAAAQNQIKQMISFIANEAQEKSKEIQKKGEEEFSIEVHRLITEQKEKIRQSYEKKAKKIETDYAIAKSMAINKQRLEKIKARQDVMQGIAQDVKGRLQREGKPEFVMKLIVQGLLMLLEKEVVVRCREQDKGTVQGCLKTAQAQYSQQIKDQTGQGGKISIDNTIDSRLALVMEQAKPNIRALLFPTK